MTTPVSAAAIKYRSATGHEAVAELFTAILRQGGNAAQRHRLWRFSLDLGAKPAPAAIGAPPCRFGALNFSPKKRRLRTRLVQFSFM
jgi:hypothetical protein